MKNIRIRPLEPSDFPNWLPLWDENNLGRRKEDVTAETWSRLTDPNNAQVNGLCAVQGDEMLGMIHYIRHPTTGYIDHVCYMQDVFVAPAHRQKGIAEMLVRELIKIGKREKWPRIHWFAENNNAAAQALYKNIGVKLDFALHVLPLDG